MSNFDLAIPLLLKNEGGFVDDFDDAGGATNFGISLKFLRTIDPDASITTIKNMTREQATFIYRKYFWEKGNYEQIESQALANKIFDMAVNLGVGTANRLLQTALNDCMVVITIDGIIGEKTLAAINDHDHISTAMLMPCLKLRLIEYYKEIVKHHPSQLKFLVGWINRALS